ncbi:antitoxin VbhA family protein [Sphingomonas sp. 2R-10]|uniref:antitoxin VbhA family protein n=1 Tax=Sphingomonas sp. 2R-10 TaxID=3045148 RepID=UPI0024BB4F47|nr:antitoxin VbhA family protein [Sphingomonas sp. 2R-10]MDJ0275990.1 antitoxin VbhA family protein [Sphingomonas sp. 2R-10]
MTVETINRISAIERARRHREVDFARGDVRYEGGILSDEIELLNARYIAGEIDSDELTGAILASQTVRSA